MDIGSIFVILALLILVVFFVSQPFLDRRRVTEQALSNSQDHELSSLMAEHERVLSALQELDFDYALGKIPAEDYPDQRDRMLQHGADVLRRLDELQPAISYAGGINGAGKTAQLPNSAEDRIEAVIAARRADAMRSASTSTTNPGTNGGKVVPVTVAAPDDELEIMLANRRRTQRDQTAGFCYKCGNAIQKSDKFCPKCGAKVG